MRTPIHGSTRRTGTTGRTNLIVALGLIVLISLAAGLSACKEKGSIKIGATSVPHAEILEFVTPLLEKEGIEIEIVEFSDYVQPNLQLADGQLAANFFQHIPYFESFIAERNLDLIWTAKVHIEPMGVYPGKTTSLEELGEGDKIGIPNDVTNGGRALALLEKAGLIKLKDGLGVNATVLDIEGNPKGLEIVELNAEILPRSLEDLDAAVINGNFAIQAGLSPLDDALFLEDGDSPYANILAIRKEDKDDPALKKIAEILTGPEVKQFILDNYEGGVLPAF